ncbi:hypothetical protein ES332_A10G068000v1 [Gossypium tomentosum]|uniref:Uncharacterized protein n=1 Tax=Gossypium tomentosum TaxID=34277 RepID=A0A5D2NM23_GOSTO|nr:hypothetical protein ES332_A10G068000v1 [Gossypium tomentosum]
MQISWKPMSSAIEMAYKHARVSAITGSDIFSYGQLNEASKLIFMVSHFDGFYSELPLLGLLTVPPPARLSLCNRLAQNQQLY